MVSPTKARWRVQGPLEQDVITRRSTKGQDGEHRPVFLESQSVNSCCLPFGGSIFVTAGEPIDAILSVRSTILLTVSSLEERLVGGREGFGGEKGQNGNLAAS